ncbi:hypothetical protein GUJ93_ZPchr0011g27179 [Zizania palustris]|uniref:Uncharacterized protein n=1 Tax=Zizania palustris TaxID=103762 RepID=A0A8J5WKG2_ZIZPA|nr:hypothetical protein GUJ93_ZPchr0011g27179 [Zizania palustris]
MAAWCSGEQETECERENSCKQREGGKREENKGKRKGVFGTARKWQWSRSGNGGGGPDPDPKTPDITQEKIRSEERQIICNTKETSSDNLRL